MEEERRVMQELMQLETEGPHLEKNTEVSMKMNLEQEKTLQQSTTFKKLTNIMKL